MNSVAMDCPSYIATDRNNAVTPPTGATIAEVDAIVKAGTNNLYGANSGGGTYVNNLGKERNSSNALVNSGYGVVVNGPTETAATATPVPAADNVDGFFNVPSTTAQPTYIGAVKDSTDDWYKVWTLPGSIKLN